MPGVGQGRGSGTWGDRDGEGNGTPRGSPSLGLASGPREHMMLVRNNSIRSDAGTPKQGMDSESKRDPPPSIPSWPEIDRAAATAAAAAAATSDTSAAPQTESFKDPEEVHRSTVVGIRLCVSFLQSAAKKWLETLLSSESCSLDAGTGVRTAAATDTPLNEEQHPSMITITARAVTVCLNALSECAEARAESG